MLVYSYSGSAKSAIAWRVSCKVPAGISVPPAVVIAATLASLFKAMAAPAATLTFVTEPSVGGSASGIVGMTVSPAIAVVDVLPMTGGKVSGLSSISEIGRAHV